MHARIWPSLCRVTMHAWHLDNHYIILSIFLLRPSIAAVASAVVVLWPIDLISRDVGLNFYSTAARSFVQIMNVDRCVMTLLSIRMEREIVSDRLPIHVRFIVLIGKVLRSEEQMSLPNDCLGNGRSKVMIIELLFPSLWKATRSESTLTSGKSRNRWDYVYVRYVIGMMLIIVRQKWSMSIIHHQRYYLSRHNRTSPTLTRVFSSFFSSSFLSRHLTEWTEFDCKSHQYKTGLFARKKTRSSFAFDQ